MRHDSRLRRLEKQLPAEQMTNEASQARDMWRNFWKGFQEVLAPYPEALAFVQKRVNGNLKGAWERSVRPKTSLWLLTATAWHALRGFPDAKDVVERAFISSYLFAKLRGGETAEDRVKLVRKAWESFPVDGCASTTRRDPLPELEGQDYLDAARELGIEALWERSREMCDFLQEQVEPDSSDHDDDSEVFSSGGGIPFPDDE
jgi:hypothetical protein